MADLFTPEQQAWVNQQAQLALTGGSTAATNTVTSQSQVSGDTLISLPNGAAVPVSTLVQNGVPGYSALPGGGFTAPADAYVVGYGGSTYQIGQHPDWFPTSGATKAGGGSTPDGSTDAASTAASVKNLLSQYGLDELVPLVDGWIRSGLSWNEIELQLRDPSTQAGKVFDKYYPEVQLRQKAGLAPMSVTDIQNYRTQTRQMMRAAGLPAGFYDSNDDFTKFIVNDVSPAELQQRIQDGYLAVAQAPSEVKDTLRSYYGIQDGDLAAHFLDPTVATPLLLRQVAAAQTGGAAVRTGYGQIAQTDAERLASEGVTASQAQQGFSTLAQDRELFTPLDAGETAIGQAQQLGAAFEGNADAQTAIQNRAARRKAQFGGGGQLAQGRGGLAGLASNQ